MASALVGAVTPILTRADSEVAASQPPVALRRTCGRVVLLGMNPTGNRRFIVLPFDQRLVLIQLSEHGFVNRQGKAKAAGNITSKKRRGRY